MRKSRFNIIYIMLTIATLLFGYVIFSETEETIKVVGLQNENIENTIVPKPLLYEAKEGTFKFENGISIYVKGKDVDETEEIYNIAGNFAATIKEVSGFEMKVLEGEPNNEKSIFFTTVENNYDLENEGYKINSSEGRIEIIGNKPEGIFRGIQTLKQMLPSEITNKSITPGIEWSIPLANIVDKPEYEYRGLMIDVARHFFTIEDLKRQIDIASQYKINKLHIHLSDDQGWRLEIKKWPELTAIGGSTEVGGGKGGYYTQEEFKDLINYAQYRYIEIIPEFDMPGHVNAALASYGFLNPNGERKPLYTGTKVGFSTLMTNNEKTYEFIEDVIKEVSAISPSKYIHIGGDEADSTKKEDYDYFVGRVSKIAQKYGKIPIGWDPIDTSPNIDSSTVLQNWKDSNEQARKKNMKMVISIAKKTYLDMKYNKDTPYGLNWAGYISVEDAYNWDPTGFAPKDLILGIEAPLWTETISTVPEMDYMIYPRLIGYSEIGWTPKENRSWNEYRERLKSQEIRLRNQGINYFKESI
ncbi:family 20 glycosylhydrolase [Clostridium perfringens]|nr:family 20 glycosylhydrolase [Clostridium perfringens]MDK0792956.1 family 20 glycosylhydrolase [Clostridium perfringens]